MSFLPNLDFSIKSKSGGSVTIAWACRKNGTSYGLAVDKGGQLAIKVRFDRLNPHFLRLLSKLFQIVYLKVHSMDYLRRSFAQQPKAHVHLLF